MIQLISFSEMNGTYAYRIQLTNASNGIDWALFFVENGISVPLQNMSTSSLQQAFNDAFNALSILASTSNIKIIPDKVQYMVSNGMLDSRDIASVLSGVGFTPKTISCY